MTNIPGSVNKTGVSRGRGKQYLWPDLLPPVDLSIWKSCENSQTAALTTHIQIICATQSGLTIMNAFTLQNTRYSAAHTHGQNIPGYSSGVSQEAGGLIRIYVACPQQGSTQEWHINFSDCWQPFFPKSPSTSLLVTWDGSMTNLHYLITSCCPHWGPILITVPGW